MTDTPHPPPAADDTGGWPHELDESPSVFRASRRVTYRSIPLLEDDPTPAIGRWSGISSSDTGSRPSSISRLRSRLPRRSPSASGWASSLARIAAVIKEGKDVTYDLKEDRDDPSAVGTSEYADAIIARLR